MCKQIDLEFCPRSHLTASHSNEYICHERKMSKREKICFFRTVPSILLTIFDSSSCSTFLSGFSAYLWHSFRRGCAVLNIVFVAGVVVVGFSSSVILCIGKCDDAYTAMWNICMSTRIPFVQTVHRTCHARYVGTRTKLARRQQRWRRRRRSRSRSVRRMYIDGIYEIDSAQLNVSCIRIFFHNQREWRKPRGKWRRRTTTEKTSELAWQCVST